MTTAVEQAVAFVTRRERARTPDIAREIGMSPPDVDLLLERPCAEGMLITCTVTLGDGRTVKEYRPTNGRASHQSLGTLSSIPTLSTWSAAAAANKTPAPKPAQPAAAAPAGLETQEDDVTTNEKIREALRTYGPMTSHDLAKHVKAKFLTQTLSTMRQRGLVVKLGGSPRATLYGLPGQKVGTAAPVAEAPNPNGQDDHLSGALAALEQRRLALMVEVEKLDNAIAAVKALG